MAAKNFPMCRFLARLAAHTMIFRPEGFDITIREIYVNAGAGFLVALTGDVMTMPGLPKKPAAEGIDVNDDGVITGLF